MIYKIYYTARGFNANYWTGRPVIYLWNKKSSCPKRLLLLMRYPKYSFLLAAAHASQLGGRHASSPLPLRQPTA